MRLGHRGIGLLLTAATAAALLTGSASAAGRGQTTASRARVAETNDARVVGTFKMRARVTTAVNVRGEHAGERFTRIWKVVPQHCQGSVCQLLALNRQRSDHRHDHLTLQRIGAGQYSGNGVFYAALSCEGHVYRHGSRVPFQITLTVQGFVTVQGIRFARRLSATYTNHSRTDSTPCPLGPSHDAGRYTGNAITPVPAPPTAAFSSTMDAATDTGSFSGTSKPGPDGAKIISRYWNFGDPRSGSANHASGRSATHRFSGPGTYRVTLTVVDANGLSSTSSASVVAPGPPSAAFAYSQEAGSATFSFMDQSETGYGGAEIVAWRWNFGDPNSGTQDTSSARDPSHTFTAPGDYTVTLTVTDANGLKSTMSRQVRYQS